MTTADQLWGSAISSSSNAVMPASVRARRSAGRCGGDAYHKISRAFVDGQPSGNLTRDHILDNITLYWLTGTGASAARSYWENGQAAASAAGKTPPEVSLPAGFTTFPGEIWRTPRSWVEKSYPNVIYFNEVDKGGHFAAWEEPDLFSEEVRAAFRPLRSST